MIQYCSLTVCLQKRGFKIGIAFEFEEWVLAFPTMDFLICVRHFLMSRLVGADTGMAARYIGEWIGRVYPLLYSMTYMMIGSGSSVLWCPG